jgi:hypothetical protein
LERLANDRIGSPAAVDPEASGLASIAGLATPVDAAPPTDLGPRGSEPVGAGVEELRVAGTAREAALVSAIVLLVFATLAWHFFPTGGVAVAALGVAMSELGYSSRRPKLAIVTLGMHAGLLVACYVRAIGSG